MKCSELMKTDVQCCAVSDDVGIVAERMGQKNIGFVPICSTDGSVIGTITDRDLALRVLGEHRNPEWTTAGDVMTADLICCSPDDDLGVAEQLMSKHKVSRIVCVDEQRRPVGVISLSDVAEAERRGIAGAVLRSVSQREVGPQSRAP